MIGKDKLPLKERAEWTDANLGLILAAADDPLGEKDPANLEFWRYAGDGAWQFLTRCFEMRDAIEWAGADLLRKGEIEGHVDVSGLLGSPSFKIIVKHAENYPFSRASVHMDGSCNGLQHYAALGRDEEGARAVNVVPCEVDKPQDVYTIVLEEVKKKVFAHSNGEEHGKGTVDVRLAKLCIEHDTLKRKTVKQTVMTVVYGVTAVGAKGQVTKQLSDQLGTKVEPAVVQDMGGYLSKLVLNSIDEIFARAMLIKRWFDQMSVLFARHNIACIYY